MRVDATPPAAWGDRFSLRARCRQPLFSYPGDWRRWAGTFYAELPRGDVAQLERHVDLPFQLAGGQGALRLWLDFQDDEWRAATADVQLADVGLRLADDVEPLAIVHAGGRLSARRDPAGVALSAEHFGFETADGVAWPASDLHFSWLQAQRSVGLKMGRRASVSRHRDEAVAAASGHAPAASTAPPRVAALPWDTDAPITGGAFTANHLDLALMRRLAATLPLPVSGRRWLADYQPEGVASNLDAHWTGPVEAPALYRIKAAVSGLSMAAGAIAEGAQTGRPGWRNASVDVDANEQGGVARLTLDDGAIELPGIFAEPVIAFDRLAAAASWKIVPARDNSQPPAISVTFDHVRFANADADGELQLQWHSGAGTAAAPAASGASASAQFGRGRRFPGEIDLKGVLAHGRAARLARYLPLPLPESTRGYIGAAFTSGEMDAVRFAVRGDLAEFPYQRAHDGEFRIDGHVSGVTLDYVPGGEVGDGTRAASQWPAFTQVQGRLVLDRGAFEIHDAAGRMGELRLHDVNGAIRTVRDQPTLSLHGEVAGPMSEFLRYVRQSPVGGWLLGGLAATTATGDADLDLTLGIPLRHAADTTVAGTLTLADNDVRLEAGAPLLADARARIAFTEHGVEVDGGHARALGGETSFDGGSQPDGSLRFSALGSVSAAGLREVAGEPVLVRLASHLSGQASYKLNIAIAKGQTEFALTSPLAGLGLALPAPLNKPADATWPLSVSTTVSFDEQGRPRDTLRVSLAQPQAAALQAEVLRDRSGAVARPIRAAYAVGAPLPALQPGGLLLLRGPSFNGDAWLAFWRGLSGPAPSVPAAIPGAAPLATGPPVPTYVPSATALRTQDLFVGGRHLTNVDVMLAQVNAGGDEVWRSNIASDQTKGVVEYRPETPTRGAELFARLDSLVLDSRDVDAGTGVTSPAAEPSPIDSVPALDIVVDSFELNAKKLGKLEVAATLQAGARDWRLTKLALTNPEARLTGSGRWSGAPARRMALDFDLQLADSGARLERLGLGQVLRKGKGSLAGSVTWTGSPLALDYPSLQGKLRVALDEGQFLKADAGAGRLLGVLSLQSLPRRFTLDFRDLFQEGFAFDNVTGDVSIDHGVATTQDLRMRSVTAAVLMSGRADLKAETQDLDVIIVPEINAGAASLAYAAINPVIGIGTFLAQLFLRRLLTEAGTRELHVTGTWADPKV
ncbi:MAG: YhdP family protein, partial [Betaproteobacteria bacterium]